MAAEWNQIDHAHYKHPSGVETVEFCEHLGFSIGNLMKYCARAGKKPGVDPTVDYEKAAWFARRAIASPVPMPTAAQAVPLLKRWLAAETDVAKKIIGGQVLLALPPNPQSPTSLLVLAGFLQELVSAMKAGLTGEAAAQQAAKVVKQALESAK